jgi:hypothetical protein
MSSTDVQVRALCVSGGLLIPLLSDLLELTLRIFHKPNSRE